MNDLVTNQTHLEVLAGQVRGPLRENQVAEASADMDLGDLVSFNADGKLIDATAITKNIHVIYRNNGFKQTYNAGDSVNIMNVGIVYLAVKPGVVLKHGMEVQVGDNASQIIELTGTNTKVGVTQGNMTTNGLIAVQL